MKKHMAIKLIWSYDLLLSAELNWNAFNINNWPDIVFWRYDLCWTTEYGTVACAWQDRMNIDQLTEMILHEIMNDTVSQLSTTMSDDDTESNMSPPQTGISAENILQRLDTIEVSLGVVSKHLVFTWHHGGEFKGGLKTSCIDLTSWKWV